MPSAFTGVLVRSVAAVVVTCMVGCSGQAPTSSTMGAGGMDSIEPETESKFFITPHADGYAIGYTAGSVCGATTVMSDLMLTDCVDLLSAVLGKARISTVHTTEIINAAEFGLIGDGLTDNSAKFKQLMSLPGRRIIVPEGHYITGEFSIPSNTELILNPGVIIEDSGVLNGLDRLINIFSENVRVVGYGAKVISQRTYYDTGEWRHGVYIWGAHNVSIEGLTSSDHGGDGFYIGGPDGDPSTDILLLDCKSQNNRRDAISVTSARRLDIVDALLIKSNGTSPQFGLVLEVHSELAMLDQVSVIRPKTALNAIGDILVVVRKLSPLSVPVSVDIVGHVSHGPVPEFRIYPGKAGVQGSIRYTRGAEYDFCSNNGICG